MAGVVVLTIVCQGCGGTSHRMYNSVFTGEAGRSRSRSRSSRAGPALLPGAPSRGRSRIRSPHPPPHDGPGIPLVSAWHPAVAPLPPPHPRHQLTPHQARPSQRSHPTGGWPVWRAQTPRLLPPLLLLLVPARGWSAPLVHPLWDQETHSLS